MEIFSYNLLRKKGSLTFENQLVFHRPGVPHGHVLVPPASRHPDTVKSCLNHQSIADEMAVASVGLLAYCSAPCKPPCQAADRVAAGSRTLDRRTEFSVSTNQFGSNDYRPANSPFERDSQ